MPNLHIFPHELACGEWRHFSWNFISCGFIAVIGTRFKEMLGRTACKHEVKHKSWKNATTVETENHQKIPIEMAFWVWWHLSGNFVFTEPERGGGNIEKNHYGNHRNIEKVIVAILNLAIVSWGDSTLEADNVNLEDRMTDGSDDNTNPPEPPECPKMRPTLNSNNRMWDSICNPGRAR